MPRELLAHYRLTPGRYDEVFEAGAGPRPHWQALFERLIASTPDAMGQRLQSVQSQLRENGVTYNIYADPLGGDRPWELDVLPLIIPAEEWRSIETAVAQRATLLNRVLVDLYGEQRLLKQGMLPPALAYGHAGFLRPLAGVRVPGGFATTAAAFNGFLAHNGLKARIDEDCREARALFGQLSV